MSIKLTELERHEAYLRLYGILTSLPIAKDKADEYLKLERKMAAELIKNWRQKYDLALKEIFKSIPEKISQEAKDIILNGLSESLGSNFGQSQSVRHLLQKYMRNAYETAKKEFAVKSHFNLSDSRAIEVLTKHNCFWLGEHYGKHIGPKISEMTQQAFENGLGRNEFANELREAFGGEVGGYKYWDVASSAALVRARSFGTIAGMEEAGIAEYEILAMGDERMCPICDNMNGRVFSVSLAREKINEVLEIEDPEKFKEAMPWQTTSAKDVSNEALQNAGMSLPPFHGRCRCSLVMVEVSYKHIAGFTKIQGEHSSEKDLVAVNPNFSTGKDEWMCNCQRCVPTYEMRRRGYNVVAKPRILNGRDDVAEKWDNIFKNANWIQCESGTGKREIEKLMKNWGDGARAEIFIVWDDGGAHVFAAENVKGKIRYICPQSGTADCSKWFKHVMHKETKICRIDTLEPTQLIMECCESSQKEDKA